VTQHFDRQLFVRRMEAAGMIRAVAEELAEVLGSVVLDGLATGRDIRDAADRLDGHLRETELRLRQESRDLELRLTTRLGGMLAAATALIVAVLGGPITLK
jgi:hypothetical protein